MAKYTIEVRRGSVKTYERSGVWEWWVKKGRKIVAGGLTDSKADAKSDAEFWVQSTLNVESDSRVR